MTKAGADYQIEDVREFVWWTTFGGLLLETQIISSCLRVTVNLQRGQIFVVLNV